MDKTRYDGLQNRCKECDRLREKSEVRKEYVRRRDRLRTKKGIFKKYYRVNPEKIHAHIIANRIRIGSECELCPENDIIKENLARHHPDYNYPEIFVTVCYSCHYFAQKSQKESI
jgi:hypothetical protein